MGLDEKVRGQIWTIGSICGQSLENVLEEGYHQIHSESIGQIGVQNGTHNTAVWA